MGTSRRAMTVEGAKRQCRSAAYDPKLQTCRTKIMHKITAHPSSSAVRDGWVKAIQAGNSS